VRAGSSERRFNPGWHLCKDVQNLLVCSEAIARSALLRQESRGAHNRLDFPEPSDEWGGFNIAVREENGGMCVERRPAATVDELLTLVERRKELESR
jgi:succinate dehydrogenase / fumarate reductase flavoprotein subunit